jgi:hypothetical protein
MIKPLEYYSKCGTHILFPNYTIDDTNGIVRNRKTEVILSATNDTSEYNRVTVTDINGKSRSIRIGRAIASTFIGPPPTLAHTADHIDRNSLNDTLNNIRWLDKSGQSLNQDRPKNYNSAYIIVKDDLENPAKEWAEYLNSKDEKNHMGREYTTGMITQYAQKKQHGFSYKEYPDLPGEVWKEITWSKTTRGRWEISDMNRVKYITKYAENVLYEERLGLSDKGYPTIAINGKNIGCHIASFITFFPEEYSAKKLDEGVLHEDDNKMDFRPHKLRLGTQNKNCKDAHDNGKFDGTRRERTKCASYINGVFEKEHLSQCDAIKYLKSIGYDKSIQSNIGRALRGKLMNENPITAYKRTWKLIG